ncbi:hypothetical protein Tco_0049512, partial [Tanacetum coccineum]
ELSAIVPAREKQTIVKSAISKYGLAEDTSRTRGNDVSANELYSQSAIYISVYTSALKRMRSMVSRIKF